MFRLKIILIAVGGVLAFLGFEEFQVSQKTSDTASDVELLAIEKSQELENNYIRVGKHWAIYPGSIYEYQADKNETGEPSNSAKVNYTYYPIISNDHPYNVAIDGLIAKYGDPSLIPEGEYPTFGQFFVLVKSKKFKTIGAIPDIWGDEESVQGLVVNRINELDNEELGLLKQSFPLVDMNKVLILEEGREPSSAGKSIGMMAGGVVLALFGLFLMIPRGNGGA
ncbi:MAG: hypothetical protein AAFX93_04575 [Verrucomicrobiota bacterium]